MNEPEVLFILKDYLYRENCPVVIKGGSIERDAQSDEFSLRLTLINVGEAVVNEVSVDLHITDRANHEIKVIRGYKFDSLSAKRNDTFESGTVLEIEEGTPASFAVSIRKVVFEDETEWTGSASWMYDSLSDVVTPEEYFEKRRLDPELGSQYKREFSSQLKKGIKVVNSPLKGKEIWLCSCGRLNRIDEAECSSCGVSLHDQSKLFADTDSLTEKLAEFRKNEEERLERERLERERLLKEEAERIEREKREAEARAKRNHMLKIGGLIACVAIIVCSVVGFTYYNRVYVPKKMLSNAQTAFNDKDYKKALELYTTLGYDKYADEITETKYQYGCSLYDEEKYSDGEKLFEELGDYKDSADKIEIAEYQSAISLYEDEKWDDAISAFQALDGYEDSIDYIQRCRTGKALEAIENNDITELKQAKSKITDKDCLDEIETEICEKGIALYEKGEEEDAEEYFAMVTSEENLQIIDDAKLSKAEALLEKNDFDSAEEILEKISEKSTTDDQQKKVHFLMACVLFESGDYDKAESELEKAGDYDGASDKLNEILYARAQSLEKAGETATAIETYDKCGDYKDSADKVKSLKYTLAKSYYDSEDYENAAKLFKELGDYEDSNAYYTRAQYEYGSKLYSDGKVVESYQALYEIKWYEPAYYDLVTKSLYYQYVYDVGGGSNPNDEEITIISDSKL